MNITYLRTILESNTYTVQSVKKHNDCAFCVVDRENGLDHIVLIDDVDSHNNINNVEPGTKIKVNKFSGNSVSKTYVRWYIVR